MSEGLQTVLVSGAVSIVVAVVSVYGVRFTARQSTKAKALETKLKEDEVRAAAYTEARESYRELVADLRQEISGVRKAQEEDRQKHRTELDELREAHRQQIADLRDERREQLTGLNDRLDQMEEQRGNDRRRIESLNRLIEALNDYIRQLIRVLRNHEIVPPPAPPGMHFDND